MKSMCRLGILILIGLVSAAAGQQATDSRSRLDTTFSRFPQNPKPAPLPDRLNESLKYIAGLMDAQVEAGALMNGQTDFDYSVMTMPMAKSLLSVAKGDVVGNDGHKVFLALDVLHNCVTNPKVCPCALEIHDSQLVEIAITKVLDPNLYAISRGMILRHFFSAHGSHFATSPTPVGEKKWLKQHFSRHFFYNPRSASLRKALVILTSDSDRYLASDARELLAGIDRHRAGAATSTNQ